MADREMRWQRLSLRACCERCGAALESHVEISTNTSAIGVLSELLRMYETTRCACRREARDA